MVHGGEFDVENRDVSEVERAVSAERELPTEKALPEFCLRFAETALQPVSRRAYKKVENINQLVSDDNFDIEELRQHAKGFHDCRWLWRNSKNCAPGLKDFSKEIVRIGCRFPIPIAFPPKRCASGFTETDDDELVEGCGFQLTRCFETRRKSCGCSAWTGYRKAGTGEVGGKRGVAD